MSEATQKVEDLVYAEVDEPISVSITPASVTEERIAKQEHKEEEVFVKYRALLKDMTLEEELELLGVSLKKAFPPLERDVEKLIVDLNLVIFRYMQNKMENDAEVRVETIRTTVSSALDKVAGALLTIGAVA